MKKIPELYEIKDEKLILNLHPGQLKAWQSKKRFVCILSGTQAGKCGRFDVLLSNGERRFVKNLCAGDEVLSIGRNLRIHKARISTVFKTGRQQLFKVTTTSGREITVTANHPFLGEDGWVPCRDFKEGDFIAVPRILPDIGTEHQDPKKMKLLGYLIGDGGLTGSVLFSNVDEEILSDLKSCLPPSCELVHADRCTYSIRRKWKGSFNPVLKMVRRCKIDTLSKHKRIPLFVFRLVTADIAPLLNGLFATDGWVDTKGIGLASASEGLIRDVAHLLLRFGINARVRFKPAKCNGKVFSSWSMAIADLRELKIFAQRIGITSKQNKLEALILKKEGKRVNTKDLIPNFPISECYITLFKSDLRHSRWNPPNDIEGYNLLRACRHKNISRPFAQKIADYFNIGATQAYSDIYWDNVKSIVDLGPDETYDIEVEGEHNFIADDFFAHNTSMVPFWLYREIQRCGGGDYLAVTSTYDLYKLKFLPSLRSIFEQVLGIGKFWSSERVIEIKNPETGKFEAEVASDPMYARIILRSAAAGAKKGREGAGGLESSTAKGAVVDECGLDSFPLQAWEGILRRLSLHEGRVLITTTLYNINWMKREIYNLWENGDMDYDVIQFPSIANPAFPRSEYERAKKTMPGWKFDMIYRGLYSHPAGQIYSDFDESVHVIKPFAIPPEWPRYVGIDFGSIHTAVLFLAEDKAKETFYVYRITLEGNLTSKQHATAALKRATNERVVVWCGGAKSEQQNRLDWQEAGVNVVKPPFYDVEPAIDRIAELLKGNRLFFFDNCERHSLATTPTEFPTIFSEFGQYSRKLDANGEPTPEIKDKEKYHRLDALRYGILTALRPNLRKRMVLIPRMR